MIRPVAPCVICNDRSAGCHSKCIRYKDFKKAEDCYKRIVADKKNENAGVIHTQTQLKKMRGEKK